MEFLGSICALIFIVSIVTSIVFGIKKIRGKDVGKKFKISNITILVSFVLAFIFIGASPTDDSSADRSSSSEQKTEQTSSKKNKKAKKLHLELASDGKDYYVKGAGGKNNKSIFVLKGNVNKKATVTVSGVPSKNIWEGKDVKKIVKKGNFNIEVPIYADEKTKEISLKIEAKDSNNKRIIKYIDLRNSTQAYAKYKESKKIASSKAESESQAKESSKAESESLAAAESQSRADSESTAASIAVSQSEAAASSSKVAASTAASQSRSNANAARSAQNNTNNTAGNDVATGEKIIGDSRSHIYHMPGQATYHLNPANAVYFNSEAEAQANGYRRSKR